MISFSISTFELQILSEGLVWPPTISSLIDQESSFQKLKSKSLGDRILTFSIKLNFLKARNLSCSGKFSATKAAF